VQNGNFSTFTLGNMSCSIGAGDFEPRINGNQVTVTNLNSSPSLCFLQVMGVGGFTTTLQLNYSSPTPPPS
jgi:hypothetical protein